MPKRKCRHTPTIGDAVEVYWPQDKCYYGGRVHHFNKFTHKFCVLYDDGDVEYLNFEDEQWRFSSRKKRKTKIAHATIAKRGRTTAPKPDETEILLEEAYQFVLKVMRKSIRQLGRSKRTITPWLAIRTAEDMLCSSLTNPRIVLGTEPVHEPDCESNLVMEEVKETISKALKNVNFCPVGKHDDENVTPVIKTSLSLIFAARAQLKHGDITNK